MEIKSTSNKIAIVYTKNPLKKIYTMDLIRWYAMSKALAGMGYCVDMVTSEGSESRQICDNVHVVPITDVVWRDYCVVKVCYQRTIEFVSKHHFTIVRLARVVGSDATSRDIIHHDELLKCQELIATRASALIVNDEVNRERWLNIYGNNVPIYLIPTGCPTHIPEIKMSPFEKKRPTALYIGHLSSKRIIKMLNSIGAALTKKGWDLVVVGPNKTSYYCDRKYELNREVCKYVGPVTFDDSWAYMQHSDVGIALAPGPYVFENETSKLYFYLRAGLPVACESQISNVDVVMDLKWGRVFEYGDVEDAADVIISLGHRAHLSDDRKMVINNTIEKHSWDRRCQILCNIIEKRIHC